MTDRLTYDDGLSDGILQGLALAQQAIAQLVANGVPQPEGDEVPNDHDLKPFTETA